MRHRRVVSRDGAEYRTAPYRTNLCGSQACRCSARCCARCSACRRSRSPFGRCWRAASRRRQRRTRRSRRVECERQRQRGVWRSRSASSPSVRQWRGGGDQRTWPARRLAFAFTFTCSLLSSQLAVSGVLLLLLLLLFSAFSHQMAINNLLALFQQRSGNCTPGDLACSSAFDSDALHSTHTHCTVQRHYCTFSTTHVNSDPIRSDPIRPHRPI